MEDFSEVARRVLRQHYSGEIDADVAVRRIAGHLRRFDNVGTYTDVPTVGATRRSTDVRIVVSR